MKTVFIGLGSNIGEREHHIRRALEEISRIHGTLIVEESSVIETKPYGFQEQPDFLNQVVRIVTELSPVALLTELKKIEYKLGRTETFRWGPRIIDLDILFVEDLIYKDEKITIPHQDATSREFVMLPMVELAPDFIDPISGKTMRQISDGFQGEKMKENEI